MHFAFPPKKSSLPPPFTIHTSKVPFGYRKKRFQQIGYVVLGLLTVLLVFRWLIRAQGVFDDDGSIPEDSKVLILTVTDEKSMSEDYIRLMKVNREEYASRHGEQLITGKY